MKIEALEVNLNNPRIRERVNKLRRSEEFDDGTKLTAREPFDDEVIDKGRLTGYDAHIFEIDEPNIIYVVFSFETPIAWVLEQDDPACEHFRFITSEPISSTTERHRDVVRAAWLTSD